MANLTDESVEVAPSAFTTSIADIIKNVNPLDGDFLMYIPPELLTRERPSKGGVSFNNCVLDFFIRDR